MTTNTNTTTHACGGTILHSREHGHPYAYCDRCHAFAHDDAAELLGAGSDAVPTGCDPARNRKAWDDGDLHSPEARHDDVPVGHVRCGSGAWSGDAEHHVVPHAQAQRAIWVPDYLRETARACGHWIGLAERAWVCPTCAEHMEEHDAEWVVLSVIGYLEVGQ